MDKQSSVEWLLEHVGEVPEYIKEYVRTKHGIEVRTAFLDGTINGMKCYRGEDLIDPQDYYNETYKGGQDV
jgi:hypothetical protein